MNPNRSGTLAQRIELYHTAYKLAWELIPSVRATGYIFAYSRFYKTAT
jgi:hypothetical protein